MSLENSILVSICMITYNHEKYISEAIDSILMQEVDFKYEIVIGEDCSTDNTRQIIMDYAVKYPDKFKLLLHEKNKGAISNFAATLKACTGKYIAILEGDDYWTDPLKLQKQVGFLENNPEYVITYSDRQAFDFNGYIKHDIGGAIRDVESIELKKGVDISTLTACFRNVLAEFPPEFECARIGDVFVWSLLGHFGKGKYLGDIKPASYRIHEGGIFSKKTEQKRLIMQQITYGTLYAYYNKIDNKELADYFLERNLVASIKVFGLRSLFKILLKKLFFINSVKIKK